MKEKELNEKDVIELKKVIKNAKKIQEQQAREEKALKTKKLVCEICGRTFYDYESSNGCNPLPLRYRKCCPICHELVVIPVRAKIDEIRQYADKGKIPVAYTRILNEREIVELDNLIYKEMTKIKAKK